MAHAEQLPPGSAGQGTAWAPVVLRLPGISPRDQSLASILPGSTGGGTTACGDVAVGGTVA